MNTVRIAIGSISMHVFPESIAGKSKTAWTDKYSKPFKGQARMTDIKARLGEVYDVLKNYPTD